MKGSTVRKSAFLVYVLLVGSSLPLDSVDTEYQRRLGRLLMQGGFVFLVVAFGLMAITVSVFAMLPDLQTEDGFRTLLAWLCFEGVVAFLIGVLYIVA